MTITVAEMIAVLQTLPQELPVWATWEGIFVDVRRIDVRVSDVRVSDVPECDHATLRAVVIDVDDYGRPHEDS